MMNETVHEPIYVGADLGKRHIELYVDKHSRLHIGHADFLLTSAAACARALSHVPSDFLYDVQAGLPVVTLAIEMAQAYVHVAKNSSGG